MATRRSRLQSPEVKLELQNEMSIVSHGRSILGESGEESNPGTPLIWPCTRNYASLQSLWQIHWRLAFARSIHYRCVSQQLA